MRAMAAAVAAGLAGILVASHGSDEGERGRAAGGRPSGRRPHAERADGGPASDAGSVRPGPRLTAPGRASGGNGPTVLGDPPGRVTRSVPADGPATAAAPAQRAQVDKLEQQLGELRGRTAALESQLARSQAQAAQLQRLSDQMADLRAQMAAESQRRAQAEESQVAQRQQVEAAVSSLLSAQQVLAGGSADVSDALSQAEGSLSGDARRDVAAARQALQNRDLSAARYYLGAAVAHAQQQGR